MTFLQDAGEDFHHSVTLSKYLCSEKCQGNLPHCDRFEEKSKQGEKFGMTKFNKYGNQDLKGGGMGMDNLP